MRPPLRKMACRAPLRSRRSRTRAVTFRRGAEKATGFLALPRNPDRCRAIIAIHEWWGLNTWVKEQATNLAANAYVVLALDLYQGRVTTNSSVARKLKRALSEDRAIRKLIAAFDYLAHRPDVDPKHIGSLGWSMGGSLALQLAIHEPRLAACVVHYGSPPTNPADIRKIKGNQRWRRPSLRQRCETRNRRMSTSDDSATRPLLRTSLRYALHSPVRAVAPGRAKIPDCLRLRRMR